MGSTGRGGASTLTATMPEEERLTAETEEREERLPDARDIDEYDVKQLQREMGQTGDEAGRAFASSREKLYVHTGKAFNINTYLATDGRTIKSPATDWDRFIDKEWVRGAIRQIDGGMAPMSQSIHTARFIDADAFEKMSGMRVGSSVSTLVSKLESGEISQRDFSAALRGIDYTHKAYTSTSYKLDHPSYGSKDVRLNMVVRQGTSAIVTNNTDESEIVVGRGTKYHFTGGYRVQTITDAYGRRKKQLVLDVYV